MRTSLNEVQQIEDYLFQKLNGQDSVLFQANVFVNRKLAENMQAQQRTYRIIHAYGRRQLKHEIQALHQRLFSEPEHRSFRQKMLALFRAG